MAIKKMMRVRELQMREYYSHLLLTTKECVILWGNCSAMAFIP